MKKSGIFCHKLPFSGKKITGFNFNGNSKYFITLQIMFFSVCCLSFMVQISANASISEKKSNSYKHKCTYRVKTGDTLFQLAKRWGTTVKKIVNTNHIPAPYNLYSGQTIQLSGTKGLTCESLVSGKSGGGSQRTAVPVKYRHKNNKKRGKEALLKRKIIHWVWPLHKYTKVLSTFSPADIANQGIVIQAVSGSSVDAAASGVVMYAGEDFSGYGKLIIIEHNQHYLSIYANSKKALVSKGYLVKAGQKIAETGSTGTQEPRLHFEIRYDGKPVDPLHYLPKR